MAVQAFAFGELSARLGFQRRVVRVASIAYGSGLLAMVGAALINGLVISTIALRYAGTNDPNLESLRYVLVACAAGNRVLASFAVVAMSLAIMLWSWALRDHGRAGRVLRGVGLLLGVGSAVAILTGALHLEVAGMTLVVVAQTVWNVGLGATMGRGWLDA